MLKRVSIQNFKSLKDVTLDLQKVNLLIGPNNSGKTNFLKALEFCYDAHEFKEMQVLLGDEGEEEEFAVTTHTVSKAYNYLKLVHKRDHRSEINFQLVFADNTLVGIEWSSEQSSIVVQKSNGKLSTDEDAVDRLKNSLGKIIIYKPDSNKLTQPGPVGTGEETVGADASNLVGFLDLMLGKYRRTVFSRIEVDLQTCVPEFSEINLDDAEPTEELRRQTEGKSFKRVGLTNGKQEVTYWADELSEGTLYFLALLCIINQPNPPKLLLLEEPEKGIHPRRIFEVIQFIFRLAEEKDIQVIMTTHSPTVVDMFKDMPESVFIFDKDDEGATHIKNLLHDVIEPETIKSKELGVEPPHYTDSLGDAWTVGFLGGVPK